MLNNVIVFLHSILNVKLKNIPSFQREIIIFRGCSLYSFHRGALDFPLGRFAPIPKSVRPTDRSTAAAASQPTTTKSRVDTLFREISTSNIVNKIWLFFHLQ